MTDKNEVENISIFVFHSKVVSGIEKEKENEIRYIDTDPKFDLIRPGNRTFYFKDLLFKGIHHEEYVAFIRQASEKAEKTGNTIIPKIFPTFLENPTKPKELEDQAGWYLFDTTPIDKDTYLNAVRVAFGAVYACQCYLDYTATPQTSKPKISVFLSTTPGQFAGNSKGGKGSIFNGTAMIAKLILSSGQRRKIMILDLTENHSHGLQNIFENSTSVSILSIHKKDSNPYLSGDFHERGLTKNIINLPYNPQDITLEDLKTLIKFGCWNFNFDNSTYFIVMIDHSTNPGLGSYVKDIIGQRKKIIIVEGPSDNYPLFLNSFSN